MPDQKEALEMALESVAYECRAKGFDCDLNGSGPILALIKDDPDELGSALFDSSFVLPIIHSTDPEVTLAKLLKTYPQIGLITSDIDLQVPKQIQSRALGKGQKPTWDGSHFGRPLFPEK
jgi:hypothetical protein